MNVINLTIDPAGADVELFDGWKSVYKFRVKVAVKPISHIHIPGGFCAGIVGDICVWMPRNVAEDLPPRFAVPSGEPLPPDFKLLHLERCQNDGWFKELVARIARGHRK